MNKTLFVSTTQRSVIQFMNKPSDWKRSIKQEMLYRAVARSENPGGHVVLGGDNVPPLVEIGLADLPKSGGARAPGPPTCDRPALDCAVNG